MSGTGLRKGLLILVLAIPASWLLYQALTNQLGPDPADVLVDQTGEWTIRLLCLVLMISPAQHFFRQFSFSKKFRPLLYRRIIGVAVWVYALLHLLSYSGFLLAWRWSELGSELIERPYISVGFAAFILLTLLALTSNDASVRRLRKRWKSLHQLVYPVAVLAAIHLIWQVRSDYAEALAYSLVLGGLLAWRWWRRRSARSA